MEGSQGLGKDQKRVSMGLGVCAENEGRCETPPERTGISIDDEGKTKTRRGARGVDHIPQMAEIKS